jgi:hypothetical protein
MLVDCESDWKGKVESVSLLEKLEVMYPFLSEHCLFIYVSGAYIVAYLHVYVSSFPTTITVNSSSLEHGPTAVETARPTVM